MQLWNRFVINRYETGYRYGRHNIDYSDILIQIAPIITQRAVNKTKYPFTEFVKKGAGLCIIVVTYFELGNTTRKMNEHWNLILTLGHDSQLCDVNAQGDASITSIFALNRE